MEESSGALLGREFDLTMLSMMGFSTFGLYENRDDITCVGGREEGVVCFAEDVESSVSLRARLAGRCWIVDNVS